VFVCFFWLWDAVHRQGVVGAAVGGEILCFGYRWIERFLAVRMVLESGAGSVY
jgi:hypothetical protein